MFERALQHLVCAACIVLVAPCAAAQTPPQAANDAARTSYYAELDKILAAHDYTSLGNKLMRLSDAQNASFNLDWTQSRTLAGADIIVPVFYAKLLWAVGANPQAEGLRDTAALVARYALLKAYADGVKCADQTAPSHHVDSIMQNFDEIFRTVASMPAERKKKILEFATLIEEKTFPMRQNDNYLCRFGLQEMTDKLEKNAPQREVPSQPNQIGKTVEIMGDIDYQPKYLSREQ